MNFTNLRMNCVIIKLHKKVALHYNLIQIIDHNEKTIHTLNHNISIVFFFTLIAFNNKMEEISTIIKQHSIVRI